MLLPTHSTGERTSVTVNLSKATGSLGSTVPNLAQRGSAVILHKNDKALMNL